MRVSCSCPVATATPTLEGWIRQVGLTPIVTNILIRCVYEGSNRALGEAIVEMFEHEVDHEVTVFYDKEEQDESARRASHEGGKTKRHTKSHNH